MIARSFLQQRRYGAIASALVLLLFLTFALSPTSRSYVTGAAGSLRPSPVTVEQETQEPQKPQEPQAPQWDLRLPDDYTATRPQSKFCADRFSAKYLEDIRDHAVSYCETASQSNLTCFHSHVSSDGSADSLCVASGSHLNVESKRFEMQCSLRGLSKTEVEAGLEPFDKIRGYWYNTGPAEIFDKSVSFVNELPPVMPQNGTATPRNYLFVKREGDVNPWHCLLEIWSAWMTMDVLRISMDPLRKEPYFASSEAEEDTQVVVLDKRGDGPYWEMWSSFSKYPAIRLQDLTTISPTANLIIPLAGASNPLWQNDWEVRDCTSSATLSAFTRRVLQMHNVSPDKDAFSKPAEISVVFVDRKGHRRLRDQEALFEALKARVPHIAVRFIDFAALSFGEQVREARAADVLVGVHGAGLTHMMWMRDGAGVTVEIQPRELNHNGFRNLAMMKGLGFYRVHGDSIDAPKEEETQAVARDEAGPGDHHLQRRGDWHWQDVALEEERFLEVMTQAIKSLYAKGNLNYDIN